MSALSDALMSFLLTTLLPWVITLMAAAVNKYLRPYATQEGFDALTGLFQKFYDDAVEKGRETVQMFIAAIIAPIFAIEIKTTVVIPPAQLKSGGLKLMAAVAEEINTPELFAPYTDENTGTVIVPK